MEAKNVILYKPPVKLIRKIDYVAKNKKVSRNQLIIKILEKVFLNNDLDFIEQNRTANLIEETHSMISILGKEITNNIDLQREILSVLLND